MIILGIDPGSRITGFGIIAAEKGEVSYIDSGCIRTTYDEFPRRLGEIFTELRRVLTIYQPTEIAIEQVFVNKNVMSALKLGQARGAAITACVTLDLPVFEYSPSQVKQAVVGKGNALKTQVQHMIKASLRLNVAPPADASDALAIALCHANMSRIQRRTLAAYTKSGMVSS